MSLPIRPLEEIARLHNDRRITVRGTQRLLRCGPYRLFVETGMVPFDDYLYDGRFLLLGSVCNVIAPTGMLNVVRAEGKVAVTELYHVVAACDDADTDYLARILSCTPAEGHADVSAQTVRLSEASVRHLPVPWPDASARRAFVQIMDECDATVARCERRIAELREEGAARYRELFGEGSAASREVALGEMCALHPGGSLEADRRCATGHFAVMSSQGPCGRTDEFGVEGPCIVVGQAGQYLLATRCAEDVYPLSDACALTMADERVPLEVVLFALHAAGARPRLRVVGNEVEALALPLERIGELKVRIGSPETMEAFREEAHRLLESIDGLAAEAESTRLLARAIPSRLLAGDETVLDELRDVAESELIASCDGVGQAGDTSSSLCDAVECFSDARVPFGQRLGDLAARIAAVFCPCPSAVFDPSCEGGFLLEAVHDRCPAVRCSGQGAWLPVAFIERMADWYGDGAVEEDLLAIGNALEHDEFPTTCADLVVSMPPLNGGEWVDHTPDENDPRWVFGTPPRNKANLAWLQHAFAHRAAGGTAVLVLACSVLHEGRGCEPSVRANLIASGCVRVVVALPARLHDVSRPALCILVLGDRREEGDAETLMVNALDCGVEQPASNDAIGFRTLPSEAIERIGATVEAWTASQAVGDQFPAIPGYACSVPKTQIAALGDLTPWAFV